MKSPLVLPWLALMFMGCTGLIIRAIDAGDGWYTGPAAAWVQAIGSIVAVGGAAGIAVWQNAVAASRDITTQAREERRRLLQRLGVIQLATEVCQQLKYDIAGLGNSLTTWTFPAEKYRATYAPMLDMQTQTIRDVVASDVPAALENSELILLLRHVEVAKQLFNGIESLRVDPVTNSPPAADLQVIGNNIVSWLARIDQSIAALKKAEMRTGIDLADVMLALDDRPVPWRRQNWEELKHNFSSH